MVKVITYGTYDLLHFGHIRLLERAKALGDYLIVGVTADDFDKTRGKINVQQSLMERVEAVRATGIADEIIIEEYEGQKIDDIQRHHVDIFTVGSDWVGKFDYLKDYCKVVYLERTEGISSSEIRSEKSSLRLGLVGESSVLRKYFLESKYVNGVEAVAVCTANEDLLTEQRGSLFFTPDYSQLLEQVDAVYLGSSPSQHYDQIKQALEQGKHVLCESPIALTQAQCQELFALAQEKGLVLMDAIKTAYATAYNRLLLMLKSGKIGQVLSVEATCTSLSAVLPVDDKKKMQRTWNSICGWGPTALLPALQILGTQWSKLEISTLLLDEAEKFDLFTKIDMLYPNAVATLKVGKGVKSEGELIISGTKGYVCVPAPWWKTDYFEVRFEHAEDNRRYFYQLDGEGIRYILVAFASNIAGKGDHSHIEETVSLGIARVIEQFYRGEYNRLG